MCRNPDYTSMQILRLSLQRSHRFGRAPVPMPWPRRGKGTKSNCLLYHNHNSADTNGTLCAAVEMTCRTTYFGRIASKTTIAGTAETTDQWEGRKPHYNNEIRGKPGKGGVIGRQNQATNPANTAAEDRQEVHHNPDEVQWIYS